MNGLNNRNKHYNSLDPVEAIESLKRMFPQYDFNKAIYTRSRDKITVICPKHGEFSPTYNNMKTKGRGCPICRGGIKYTQESALAKLKTHFPNYDFSKFEYKGYKKDCILVCENGHQIVKKFRSFSEGFGCLKCSPNSKKEEHLRNYIENELGYISKIDRSIIKSSISNKYLEIDIYIPELKLGFEFNGSYWHSDEAIYERTNGKYKTAKEYHDYKFNKAKENGVDLYFIEEEMYDEDIKEVYKFIRDTIKENLSKK